MAVRIEDDVLRALRRITRAIDLHSRHLATTYGLTVPQLVCLRVVGSRGPMSPSQLANEVSLSQATITGILDRLAARDLITRERSSSDRRVVTVRISDAGRTLVESAPSPLQERFVARLGALSHEEREIIRLTLNKIVRMMDGESIDAAPLLTSESVIAGSSGAELPAAPAAAATEVAPLALGSQALKARPRR
jgi:DNA-binding MarR family transcriptional regulator